MKKVLMILEVGQKQSFIFESKEVRSNIINSNLIRWVTDAAYFEEAMKESAAVFDKEKCLVYSGGGHTILEFADKEEAVKFAQIISKYTMNHLNGLGMYVKTNPYDECLTPGENIQKLIKDLEYKKEMRSASFQQGSFGIEEVDSNSKKRVPENANDYYNTSDGFKRMQKALENSMSPCRHVLVKNFNELGNFKGQSSFIAVVHIDGNNMGKRVEAVRHILDRQYEQDKDWQKYKRKLKEFSEIIDQDFQAAYHEMILEVEKAIENKQAVSEQLKLEDNHFPIRRIITAGDDVCYVSEGRIGIESAVIFLKKLEQKINNVDNESYRACAGVAIIPTKYPFFKAYQLAEQLCLNAKRFVSAAFDQGEKLSAIDWHMEYGEIKNSLHTIRKDFTNDNGAHLELRPYFISWDGVDYPTVSFRNYKNFRLLIHLFQDQKFSYAKGKLKELRDVLKRTEEEADYYIQSSLLNDLLLVAYQGIFVELDTKHLFQGKAMERQLFYSDINTDHERRCLIFDALELLDEIILLEEI